MVEEIVNLKREFCFEQLVLMTEKLLVTGFFSDLILRRSRKVPFKEDYLLKNERFLKGTYSLCTKFHNFFFFYVI